MELIRLLLVTRGLDLRVHVANVTKASLPTYLASTRFKS